MKRKKKRTAEPTTTFNGLGMTQHQYNSFSREWQNLFNDLHARGYSITYHEGKIFVSNDENRLTAELIRGRWVIELQKPFKEPDQTSTTSDSVAISRVEHWLLKARANRKVYSFAILNSLKAFSEE